MMPSEPPRWAPPTGPPLAPTGPPPAFADGEPHRTSRRTLALSAIGVVGSIVGFLFLTAVPQAAPPGQPDDSPVVLLLFLAVLLFRSVVEPLVWWSKTYRVGDRSVRLDHGVLARHRQEVPYDRIQQVEVRQPLLAQLLGVALVRIDTAGETGSTSISLAFLDRPDADALRVHLLRRRDEAVGAQRAVAAVPGAPPPLPPPDVPILSIDPAQVVTSAVTEEGVLVGALVTAAAAAWLVAAAATGSSGVAWIAGLTIVAAAGTVMTAVVLAVGWAVQWWGCTLGSRGDDLHLRRGLLDVRELTVPRRRIQQVTVLDNPLRRLLGITTVLLRSAAAPGAAGEASTLVLPYVRRADVGRLLEALAPGRGWVAPEVDRRPPRARRRAVRRRCVLLALLVAAPAIATWPGGAVLAGLAVLGVPWGYVAHSRAGLACTDRVVVLSHGVVRHRTEIVPIDRIQSCRTASSPFQRRAGLQTLWVDVASRPPISSLLPSTRAGAPRLHDADSARADELRNALPRASSPR